MGGRKGKQKAKRIMEHEDEVEDDDERSDNTVSTPLFEISSDDDEEANQDLSLKIVEKALRMREAKQARNDDVLGGGGGDGDVVSIASSSRQPEVVVERNDAVLDGPGGIAASGVIETKKKEVKKKKAESEDQSVTIVEEQETEGTIKTTEKNENECTEANTVQMGDNMVLRKLLRGPRYFDPPDSGWGACYNCGEEGHTAVNCTAAKRKKPCFLCGILGHSAKQCIKAQDCFICKKGGHRAKNCPEKHSGGSESLSVCLKCGNSGHDMFSCKNDYLPEDLKEIQCYVCKRFGHLCCVNTDDVTPGEVSCYKCGQLGHTGLACSRLRDETAGAATPSTCFKCGEQGHFARECTSSTKVHFGASSRLRDETAGAATPSSCYKCGEQGHFARECTSSTKVGKRNREFSNTKAPRFQEENDYMGFKSAPHDMSKARKKKRPLTEERGSTTPKKSKSRGGWMTEHPGEFSPSRKKQWPLTEERGLTTPRKSKSRGGWMTEHPGEFTPSKSKRSSWRSPVTPSTKSTKIPSFSSGSHTSSSKSSKMWNGNAGISKSQGSSKASHHRFSASRFGNSSSDELKRSYNWW